MTHAPDCARALREFAKPVVAQQDLVADIAGGLEGLAVQLADSEVGLRAVGAI